jgi:general secretion pathway protein G
VPRAARKIGFSLTELMAAVALAGLLAALVLPRLTAKQSAARKAACEAIQGDVELQCEIWRHNTGSWPATNLSDISGNVSYFPTGVPTCPSDGTSYTIDASGKVVGHNH